MAQQNWQINTGYGRDHIIGIYHGDQSGHVVVHCNNRVLLLDFNVLQPKSYKFFIDQELCELNIDKDNNCFCYDLSIDYQADTPKNRHRDAEEKEERRAYLLSLLTGVGILLVAFVIAYYIKQ